MHWHSHSTQQVSYGRPFLKSTMPILRAGFRVFASARSSDRMRSLASKGVEVLELDVTKSESIVSVKEEVSKRTRGKLNVLVNNA